MTTHSSLFAAILVSLAACSADPVLLPDAGPCGGACGPGTVCASGACVSADAGAPDAPVVDAFVGTDPAPTDVQALDAPPGDLGADDDHPDVGSALDTPGVDVVPADVGTPDAGFVDVGTDSGIDRRCDSATFPTFCTRGANATGGERLNFCTDLLTDRYNCGGCARERCVGPTHCEGGRCVLD